MLKLFTISILSLLFFLNSIAINKTWMGADGGLWSVSGNWAGGTPGVNDTAIFNNSFTISVDINPNIAGLQVINNAALILSAAASRTIIIGNGSSGGLVFLVDNGSTMTLGSGFGVSIQTYGSFSTNIALIRGTLILGQGNSVWTVNNLPGSYTNTDISGTLRVASNNTGSVLLTGTTATLKFFNGSLLDWQRNGGAAPLADFQNGSVINISGITGSMVNLNSGGIYNGLLIWNCINQTSAGSSAIILPTGYTTMDSIRVVNTGTGTLRLATNPNGYNIKNLEVQGGIVELSATVSNSSYSLSDTISNELKITGGKVIGNATFAFDNLGAAYPTTTTVGKFRMTGGIFDFTNRSAGNLPGGAFTLHILGDVIQPAGQIKATQGFGLQNQLIMAGMIGQNLELSNMTDLISLVITNPLGVFLKRDLVLPYYLNLQQGYLQLNDYNATTSSQQISQSVTTPTPKVVTNGLGKLFITNVSNGASQIFPIAPFANGYNPLTIANNDIGPKSFMVRTIYGIDPATGIDTNRTINRTWNISSTTPVTANAIGLTFQYADSEKITGATVVAGSPMELGHFNGTAWGIDPAGTLTPSGGPVTYSVGPFLPANLDSSFVIGNIDILHSSVIYIFNGTGNWDLPGNWVNSIVPPVTLPAAQEILIDPSSGSCILNITQNISPGGKITIKSGKSLIIPGDLIIQ